MWPDAVYWPDQPMWSESVLWPDSAGDIVLEPLAVGVQDK